MINRIWDVNNKYTQGHLKEYNNWVIEVNYRQHTLGSFIIFSKRNVENISDLNDEELLELRVVMNEIEDALKNNKLFNPNRFNYLQLGNKFHSLHFHGIPRYATIREFDNKVWEDKTFDTLPNWSKEDKVEDLIIKVREAMKLFLN